jgi:hypothetical protein
MSGRIITPIATVVWGVTKEDAGDGARSELVGCGGRGVRIAETSKDAEARVVWRRLEEKMVRSVVVSWTAGPEVEKKGGSGEGFSPEARRDGGMEEERADAIVESTEYTLGATILLRGVGAGKLELNAVAREEGAGCCVVKFFSIVCLKTDDGFLKLSRDIRMKFDKMTKHFRLMTQRKGPCKM